MARWPAENRYDDVLRTAGARWGVPLPLLKAVTAQESGFNPAAYRGEPQIGDASRGLMQVLYGTAKGLGYTGPVGDDGTHTGGMYDPAVGADLGAHYLRQCLDRAQSVNGALSAYNGGFRPSLGFGVPFKDGTFRNQAYVDGVREKLRYFAAQVGADLPTVEDDAVRGDAGVSTPLVLGLVLALGLLIALRFLLPHGGTH